MGAPRYVNASELCTILLEGAAIYARYMNASGYDAPSKAAEWVDWTKTHPSYVHEAMSVQNRVFESCLA